MDSIVELVKRNEQLLLENAEALNDEEVEQEDIDEYLKIQGATKEELSAFENQFQIRLPEDFKIVYSKSTPKRPPAPYIHKVGNQFGKLSISTLSELW